MKEKNEYDLQAEKFLSDTSTEFKAVFIEHGRHFDDDKETRDIYEVTLTRGGRSFVFRFGQSIQCSGAFTVYSTHPPFQAFKANEKPRMFRGDCVKNPDFSVPRAYDVLACLTNYDPGDFAEFCSSYGYDTDSRRAEKTYKAVLNEWQNVRILWTDEEIERLQEIQ